MTDRAVDQPIHNSFFGSSLVSLSQYGLSEMTRIFDLAERMADPKHAADVSQILEGKVLTLLFFEPSSRTFGSFSSAAKRLGAHTIEIHDAASTSTAKGESLEDTVRVFASYSDGIIMRHHMPGAALRAATVISKPLVNAGDGIGEHPTQALLDIYTIRKHVKNMDNLKGLVVGDLYNGRTVHSLIEGLSKFKNPTIYLLAPSSLQLSPELQSRFTDSGVTLKLIASVEDIPSDCDFWYWTRVQKERFTKMHEYEEVKNSFILTPSLAQKYAGKKTLFMHPLPRVGEIDEALDEDPRAIYFEQVQNGLYVRQALLALIFGKTFIT